MAYKKPQIVAKSAARQSLVAGCPQNTSPNPGNCALGNLRCLAGPIK